MVVTAPPITEVLVTLPQSQSDPCGACILTSSPVDPSFSATRKTMYRLLQTSHRKLCLCCQPCESLYRERHRVRIPPLLRNRTTSEMEHVEPSDGDCAVLDGCF